MQNVAQELRAKQKQPNETNHTDTEHLRAVKQKEEEAAERKGPIEAEWYVNFLIIIPQGLI